MNSQKSLFALGSVTLAAVLVTTGCSPSSYGVVPAPKGQLVAVWENPNKAEGLDCSKNEYAVFTDEERDEDQECIKPSRKSKSHPPVYDLNLVEKYPCNGAKEFLAYVEGRDDLVFCFNYKRDSQKPKKDKFFRSTGTSKTGTSKTDTSKTGTSKTDTSKTGTSKTDTSNSGTSNSGTSNSGTSNSGTSNSDTSNSGTSRRR